jgi:hypothetical protein
MKMVADQHELAAWPDVQPVRVELEAATRQRGNLQFLVPVTERLTRDHGVCCGDERIANGRRGAVGTEHCSEGHTVGVARLLVGERGFALGEVDTTAALLEANNDPPGGFGGIEQDGVEVATGNGMDHVGWLVAVGLHGLFAIDMHHSAAHRNGDRLDSFGHAFARRCERRKATVGEGEVDRSAGRDVDAPHVGSTLEYRDIVTGLRQVDGKQRTARPAPDHNHRSVRAERAHVSKPSRISTNRKMSSNEL